MIKPFLFTLLFCISIESRASAYLKHFSPSVQKSLSPLIHEAHYKGVGGKKNHFTYFQDSSNEIATPLILVTGLEDPIPLWFLSVKKALDFGFRNIVVVELRGQGQSEMILPGKRRLYIEDFDHYSQDFMSFIKKLHSLGPQWEQAPYVVSHSTGSLVVAKSLPLWKKNLPGTFPKKLAFWTPFFKLKISPFINNTLVRSLLRAVDGTLSFFGSPLLVRHYKPKAFAQNTITTDPKNFRLSQTMKFEEGLGTEGLSLRWVLETLEAIEDFRAHQREWIQIPTLLFKAEIEQIVDNNYDLKNPFIKEKLVPDAKHALNLEKPSLLSEVTKTTFNFLLKN